MNKSLFIIILSIFFIKNLNADINKEVSDLKNEFKQIKEIYENKIGNSILTNLLVNYKDQTNDKYSLENICRNLETNISVVIPVYLKDC